MNGRGMDERKGAAEIGFLNGGVMNGRKLGEWVIKGAAHLG